MRHHPELSIVIPAFNEEHRIGPTLLEIDEFLAASGLSYEILVVDDGSEDGTALLVCDMRRRIPALRCLVTRPNRGKGHAVRVGMLAARGAIRLMCDADGSTPPREIPKVVNPIRMGKADIAIGSRYVRGASCDRKQPFYRRWWSRLANRVVQMVLVPGILDTQCGFKAFSAAAAESVFSRAQIDGWAFDLEVLALAKRLGFEVVEQGVYWSDDPRSRISPIADALRVIRELLMIRRNFRRGVYGELLA
jgi:glycosyltransferase involved in cell wall biosynthesis